MDRNQEGTCVSIGESQALLAKTNDLELRPTSMYSAFGCLYRAARTLHTVWTSLHFASNTSHHLLGSGTLNRRAAAYTTPHATTSLLKRTQRMVRKLEQTEPRGYQLMSLGKERVLGHKV